MDIGKAKHKKMHLFQMIRLQKKKGKNNQLQFKICFAVML